MTTISADTHVAALVLEDPSRARVFERFGIDYCCGGKTPLEAACAERGLDLDTVIAALGEPRSPEAEDVDWAGVPVSALVDHIVEQHHAYLREELPPLTALVDKVARAHGDAHPELTEVRETFAERRRRARPAHAEGGADPLPGMRRARAGTAVRRRLDSVESPIGVMLHEHDEVAAGLGPAARR